MQNYLQCIKIILLFISNKLIKQNKNIIIFLPNEVSQYIMAINNTSEDKHEVDHSKVQIVLV